MKNQYSILAGILLTACAVAFAACTKDKTIDDEGTDAVIFTTGITTRATAQEWEQDDRIGIFMIAEGAELSSQTIMDNADNKQYSASAGVSATLTSVSDDDKIYFPRNGDRVDFIAYYPYLPSTDITDYAITVNVSNQSEAFATDLLYSDDAVGMNRDIEQVGMTFDHVMGRLNVNISLGSELAGAEIQSVSFAGFATAGTFSLADAQWTAGQSGEIIPYRSENTFSAHIIPQDISAGRVIVIDMGEQTYLYPIERDLPQGKSLTYNLIVGREGVLRAYATISEWVSNEIEDQTLQISEQQIIVDWQGYNDEDFTAIEILGNDGKTYTAEVSMLDDMPDDGPVMITSAFFGMDVENLTANKVWVYYMGQKIEVPEEQFELDNGILIIDYRDIIAKRTHLEYINTNDLTRSGDYFQICDIDLENETIKPIGYMGNIFTGSYDGRGFKIENLAIEEGTNYYAGLFGYCQNSTLKNIHIASGSIEGNVNVGGICGYFLVDDPNVNATIENCSNSVSVTGSGANVGGICGYSQSVSGSKVTIKNCSNTGDVIGTYHIGGICGYNHAQNSSIAVVIGCTNSGTIFGTNRNGGVCGENSADGLYSKATIENCSNSASVSGSSNPGDRIGGVCGLNNANQNNSIATIIGCFNKGSVYGMGQAGGVCGKNSKNSADNNTATVIECYSVAAVTVDDTSNSVGGVCGYNDGGTFSYCFWSVGNDTDTSPTRAIGFGGGGETCYQFGADDGNGGVYWPDNITLGIPVGYWKLAPNGRWTTLGAWEGSPQTSTYPQLQR